MGKKLFTGARTGTVAEFMENKGNLSAGELVVTTDEDRLFVMHDGEGGYSEIALKENLDRAADLANATVARVKMSADKTHIYTYDFLGRRIDRMNLYGDDAITWEEIVKAAEKGNPKSIVSVGDKIPLLEVWDGYGRQYAVNAVVAGFNMDPLLAGSDAPKAAVTFVTEDIITLRKMNNYAKIGGYADMDLYSYLDNFFISLFPTVLSSNIKSVLKFSKNPNGNDVGNYMKLFPLSRREVYGETAGAEGVGPIYSDLFPDNASRVKRIHRNAEYLQERHWWLRTSTTIPNTNFYYVPSDGSDPGTNSAKPDVEKGIVLGFCL